MKKLSIILFIIGVALAGAGLFLLSIEPLEVNFVTTSTIALSAITLLVVGMMMIIKSYKMMFLYDNEEIEDMNEDEIEQIMIQIENEYANYAEMNPRIQKLYEKLGKKMFELNRLDK